MSKLYVELEPLLKWIQARIGSEGMYGATDLLRWLKNSAAPCNPPDPPGHGAHIDAGKLMEWLRVENRHARNEGNIGRAAAFACVMNEIDEAVIAQGKPAPDRKPAPTRPPCCGTCNHMPNKNGTGYIYCPILSAMEGEFPDVEYHVCGHHSPVKKDSK